MYSELDQTARMDAENNMRRRDREEGRDVGGMRRGLGALYGGLLLLSAYLFIYNMQGTILIIIIM